MVEISSVITAFSVVVAVVWAVVLCTRVALADIRLTKAKARLFNLRADQMEGKK